MRKLIGVDPEGFAAFWEAWPRSVRKIDRMKCAQMWKRAGMKGHLPKILAHVAAMKGTTQWCTGFEPAPLTYLSRQRWDDDLPPDPDSLANTGVPTPLPNPMHANVQFT